MESIAISCYGSIEPLKSKIYTYNSLHINAHDKCTRYNFKFDMFYNITLDIITYYNKYYNIV